MGTTRPVSSPIRVTHIGSLQIIILGVVIAAMMLVFGKFFRTTPNSQNASSSPAKSDFAQPQDSAVASLLSDSTLSYDSHVSDVSIYFIGATATCIIDSEPFDGRGGSAYRNVTTYSIKTFGNSKWQISIGGTGGDARNNQSFVFWVTRTNGNAANAQPTIEAKGNIYDWAGHAMWPGGEQAMELKFVRGKHINPAALPEGSASAVRVPEGFTIPPYTLSPGGDFGVLVPDFAHYKESGDSQNKLVATKSGEVIATINGLTWYEDTKMQMNNGSITSCWSTDGTTLSWVVGGKWFPRTFAVLKLRGGAVAWQLDVLKCVQREILSRTRAAVTSNYAAAMRQNQGNGSAFPDGFSVDVTTPTTGFSLPWVGNVTLDSNPKSIPNWPPESLVRASMQVTIHPDGSANFSNYMVTTGQAQTTTLATPTPQTGNRSLSPTPDPYSSSSAFRLSQQQAALPGEHFPDTRLRRMSNEEAARMSPAVIRYAINEMYARHGADFRDKEIKANFQRFAWYHPVPSKSYDAIDSEFTEVERDNVKLLGIYRDTQRGKVSVNPDPGPTPFPQRTKPKQSDPPNKAIGDRTRGFDNL